VSIIKTKPKKEAIKYPSYSFRADTALSERIERAFNALLLVQGNVKKAELIRDAVERGLTDIEKQLETTK
jgi:hypothetical protein